MDVGRVGAVFGSLASRTILQPNAGGVFDLAGLASRTPALASTASFKIRFGRSVDEDKAASRFGGAFGLPFRMPLSGEHLASIAGSHLQIVFSTAQRILSNTRLEPSLSNKCHASR